MVKNSLVVHIEEASPARGDEAADKGKPVGDTRACRSQAWQRQRS